MTKQQFDLLYLDKAVNCRSKELSDEFLKLAREFGYRRDDNPYGKHKEETCFRIHDSAVDCFELDFYKTFNYEIVEFKSNTIPHGTPISSISPAGFYNAPSALLTNEEKEFLRNFDFVELEKENDGLVLYIDQCNYHAIDIEHCKHKFNGLEKCKHYTLKELGL